MSETAVESIPVPEPADEASSATRDEQLVAMLVDRARSEGLQLNGEGGFLQQLTKRVLESALEGEIADHVGYEKHDPAGKNNGNSHNGTRAKTVLTDVGPVEVKGPQDTAGSFEPQIVKKRQRRLTPGDGEHGRMAEPAPGPCHDTGVPITAANPSPRRTTPPPPTQQHSAERQDSPTTGGPSFVRSWRVPGVHRHPELSHIRASGFVSGTSHDRCHNDLSAVEAGREQDE